jgi:hypothetical protein
MTFHEQHLTGLVEYHHDGTITAYKYVLENNDRVMYTVEDLTQFPRPIPSYKEVLKQHPIQNNNDAAKLFINKIEETFDVRYLNKTRLNEESILIFTADYGLYWWDYKGGYDIVLAELAWNHSVTQQISLVRGAANRQGKSWGTILTWKYTQAPFLAEGEEMFEHLKVSYETGAEYVLIFNYSEDPANPNILQEEHFQALERFWNEVVQNPEVKHGGIKADAVLVLPKNYGWGMRDLNDKIWGIWPADSSSQEIWNQIQTKTEQHGLELDIVFEDSNQFVEGKYAHVYYWNQRLPTIISVFAILLIITLAVLFAGFYKLRQRHKSATRSAKV